MTERSDRFQKVLDYVEAHRDEYIQLLVDLCRQPSLAGTGEGIPEMIQLVQDKMRAYGIEPTLVPTDGNPVIYADIKGESGLTFGCYDHYDVQPVEPLDQWLSDPFAAEIRDGVNAKRPVHDSRAEQGALVKIQHAPVDHVYTSGSSAQPDGCATGSRCSSSQRRWST